MNSCLLKYIMNKTSLQIIELVYMYKQDLALNNLQWLIYIKTQPNQTHSKLCSQADAFES